MKVVKFICILFVMLLLISCANNELTTREENELERENALSFLAPMFLLIREVSHTAEGEAVINFIEWTGQEELVYSGDLWLIFLNNERTTLEQIEVVNKALQIQSPPLYFNDRAIELYDIMNSAVEVAEFFRQLPSVTLNSINSFVSTYSRES